MFKFAAVPPMHVGAVARVLGVSAERVRQLDGDLEPSRDAENRRLYDPERVHRVAMARAASSARGSK